MNFKNKTTEQILKSYEFPHRFLVYYASQCAKGAVQAHVKDPDPGTLKAIDITERFGLGEEIGQEELIKTTGDAYAAARAAVYAAAYTADAAGYAADAAGYAADAAAYAADAAAYASNAADAAAYAARPKAEAKYKKLLITLINQRFSEVEKIMMFGEI